MWNLDTMLPMQTLSRHEGSVNCVVIHKDMLLSGSEDMEIKVCLLVLLFWDSVWEGALLSVTGDLEFCIHHSWDVTQETFYKLFASLLCLYATLIYRGLLPSISLDPFVRSLVTSYYRLEKCAIIVWCIAKIHVNNRSNHPKHSSHSSVPFQ